MKRYLMIASWVVAVWCVTSTSFAADAVSIARRQEAEEQQRAVNARLGALEEALQSYQQEINSLKAEIRRLREDLGRSRGDSAGLQALAEKINEVDKNRVADNKMVLNELRQLQKGVTSTSRNAPPRPASTEEYQYSIRDGDTLSHIIRGLREDGFTVDQAAVMKANPKVNWTRLQIGQKIIIPAPAKK